MATMPASTMGCLDWRMITAVAENCRTSHSGVFYCRTSHTGIFMQPERLYLSPDGSAGHGATQIVTAIGGVPLFTSSRQALTVGASIITNAILWS